MITGYFNNEMGVVDTCDEAREMLKTTKFWKYFEYKIEGLCFRIGYWNVTYKGRGSRRLASFLTWAGKADLGKRNRNSIFHLLTWRF